MIMGMSTPSEMQGAKPDPLNRIAKKHTLYSTKNSLLRDMLTAFHEYMLRRCPDFGNAANLREQYLS